MCGMWNVEPPANLPIGIWHLALPWILDWCWMLDRTDISSGIGIWDLVERQASKCPFIHSLM